MQLFTQPIKTRLAPSPTGHLHLGHVLHVLYVTGIAAKVGAEIHFRLEDHDRIRCRPEFEASIIEDLGWLGVNIPSDIWRQSDRHHIYQTHLEKLIKLDLVYACRCSRRDVQKVTGQEAGELNYPGTCREKNYPLDTPGSSLRLKLKNCNFLGQNTGPEETWPFMDLFIGEVKNTTSGQIDDVIIRDRNGQWTYQFTVVIDDLEQHINLIIRGQDLLLSTPRQLAMRSLLSPDEPRPIYLHHPLILGEDGQKLAKRKSSEAISYLRRMGLTPGDVKGLAAYSGGLISDRQAIRSDTELDFKLKVF